MMKWNFQPPLAPHFSGVHERMIRSAKRAIYLELAGREVNDEELTSIFTGVEGLLNSRPLTYQSASAADLTPLTPNHFLIGNMSTQLLPSAADDLSHNLRDRWRAVQSGIKDVWDRWMAEWLPSLRERRKWQKEYQDLKVDDIVLIFSPDQPRGRWPMGRITDIFTGPDGHVRTANVKVSDKIYKRPIVRLCPLPL